jgi:hypothetical protein
MEKNRKAGTTDTGMADEKLAAAQARRARLPGHDRRQRQTAGRYPGA